MKNVNVLRRIIGKMIQVLTCIIILSTSASAFTYTAVLSGNFNNVLTWGGVAPGSLLTADSVIIPSGISVTLNLTQAFSSSATLIVNGTLTSGSNLTGLVITGGNLAGSGTINADSLVLGLSSGFDFTGTITAQALTSLGTSQSSAASVTVGSNLYINTGTFSITSGSVTLSSNSNVMMNGGSISVGSSGSLVLTNAYNVNYSGSSSTTAGVELTGSGLNNVNVNLSSGSLTLSSNMSLNGILALTSGNLVLNGYNLSLGTNADFASSGSGAISSTSSSNIAISSGTSLSGALRFSSGNNTVNNFTLNMGNSNNTVMLGNTMNLNGTLTLTSGNLVLNNNDLSFTGSGNFAASGSGHIYVTPGSNITVTSSNTLSGGLRFGAGYDTVNNFTINMGTSSSAVSLGSGLNIKGTLSITNGNLVLNNNDLTFTGNADFAASGSGSINSTSGSNISITSTGSFSGGLRFNTGNNTVNNFTLNMGNSANTVSLGSSLNVNGTLSLNNGTLTVPSSDTLSLAQNTTFNSNSSLTINGNLSGGSTTALIMTSGALVGSGSITIDSVVLGLMSGFNFTGSMNAQQLTSLGTNQSTVANVMVGSNLYINNGTFTISGGSVSLSSNSNIRMNGGAISVSGSGSLGLTNTYNVFYSGSSTTAGIELTGSGLNNLTVNLMSGGLTLSSDLTENGTLTLTSGDLVLNNHNLSFGANSDFAISGSGGINTTSGSNISVMSSTSLSGAIRFANSYNTVHNFTLNMGSSNNSVSLGSALNIAGTLTLTMGDLILNNNDLTFATTGDFASSGSGNINSSMGSNITIMSANTLSGALRFSATGNTVNNFTLDMGSSSNIATLGTNVYLNGTLTLTLGTLIIPAGVTVTYGQNILFGSSSALTVNGTFASANGAALIMTAGTLSGGGSILADSIVLGMTSGFNFTGALTTNILTSLGTSQSAAATVNISHNLDVNAGTLNIAAGSLTMAANSNINMNGGTISLSGSGTIGLTNAYNVVYNGSSSSSVGVEITGSGLNNLTLNLSSGSLYVSSNPTINGTLSLNSGLLDIGSGNISIAAGGSISGGSSSSYVVTGNGGSLVMNLAAGSSATYPVGTMLNFAPAVVTANSGSVNSNIGVMAMDSVFAHGSGGTNLSVTQSVVNATWFLSSTATSGLDLNLQLMWSANMELNGFNRSNSYISHYTNGSWDANAVASATTSGSMYAMSRNNITSLSPFAVADNNANLDVAVNNVASNNATDMVLYPNPTTGTLYFNTSLEPEFAFIFDIGGHLLKTALVKDKNHLSVSELPAGLYNISFYGQGIQIVRKLVKE